MGKPNKYLIDMALERTQSSRSQTVMVGDRLETDILAAQRSGCRSCLVLSGVSSLDQANKWQPRPDYIYATLSEMVGL